MIIPSIISLVAFHTPFLHVAVLHSPKLLVEGTNTPVVPR